MKHIRFQLLLLAITISISLFQLAWAGENNRLIQNSDEYIQEFNAAQAENHQVKIEAGISQGLLENTLYWLVVLVFLGPFVISLIKKASTASKLSMLFASFPNIYNFSLLLISNSIGSWGSMKHPKIHGLVEQHKEYLWDVFIISIPVGLLLYALLIWYSYKNTNISKSVIVVNSCIWIIFTIGVSVFALFLSGLASQGAGH